MLRCTRYVLTVYYRTQLSSQSTSKLIPWQKLTRSSRNCSQAASSNFKRHQKKWYGIRLLLLVAAYVHIGMQGNLSCNLDVQQSCHNYNPRHGTNTQHALHRYKYSTQSKRGMHNVEQFYFTYSGPLEAESWEEIEVSGCWSSPAQSASHMFPVQ